MSLHAIAPESKTVEGLIEQLKKYLPRAAELRTERHEVEFEVEVDIRIVVGSAGFYYIETFDTYEYEAFLDSSGNTLREGLIAMEPKLQQYTGLRL